jgi:hypothetical protein
MSGLAGSVQEGSVYEVVAVYDELIRMSTEDPTKTKEYQPNDETYTLLFEAFLFHSQYDRLSHFIHESSFLPSSTFQQNLPQIKTLRRVALQLAKEGMNKEVDLLLPLILKRNRGPSNALDMFLKRLKDIQIETEKQKAEQQIQTPITTDDDRIENRKAVKISKNREKSEEEKQEETEEVKEQDPSAPLDFRAYYNRSKK